MHIDPLPPLPLRPGSTLSKHQGSDAIICQNLVCERTVQEGPRGWGHLQCLQLDLRPFPLWRQEVALQTRLCPHVPLRFSSGKQGCQQTLWCKPPPAQAQHRSGLPTPPLCPTLVVPTPQGCWGPGSAEGIQTGASAGGAGKGLQVGGRRKGVGKVEGDAGQAAAPPRSLPARRRRQCPSWAGGGEDGDGRGGGGGGGGIWSFPPQQRRRRPLGSRRGRRPRLRWRSAAVAVALPAAGASETSRPPRAEPALEAQRNGGEQR